MKEWWLHCSSHIHLLYEANPLYPAQTECSRLTVHITGLWYIKAPHAHLIQTSLILTCLYFGNRTFLEICMLAWDRRKPEAPLSPSAQASRLWIRPHTGINEEEWLEKHSGNKSEKGKASRRFSWWNTTPWLSLCVCSTFSFCRDYTFYISKAFKVITSGGNSAQDQMLMHILLC